MNSSWVTTLIAIRHLGKFSYFPAISINDNQSLIAINIINDNPLIIIDWFN